MKSLEIYLFESNRFQFWNTFLVCHHIDKSTEGKKQPISELEKYSHVPKQVCKILNLAYSLC